MNKNQHGFRSGRSTITQLLKFFDDILIKLENGEEVDVIYLDFAKAFNKVDHNALLKKMASLGFGGKIITWTEAFLKNRVKCVRGGDCSFYTRPSYLWRATGFGPGSNSVSYTDDRH